MKKILLILTICLTAFSCDVLDVKPQSSIPADKAFQDKAGIEKGILGAYSAFQSLSYYGRSYITLSDLAADNLSHPDDATATEYAEVDNNAILPENGSVGGIWAIIYDGINVANNVIEKVPGIEGMSEEEKNAALGELYFIRALDHFNLLNYFGAIPLKLSPTVGVNDLDVPRDPVDAVYDQIIEDLLFAGEHMPAGGNKVRASKYAAKALLARVYLYHGDYSGAADMATEVIENGGYSLMADYADIFTQEQNQESIFEIDFSEVDRNRIAEYNFPKSLNGRREVQPAESLLNAYENGDDRFEASIAFDSELAYAIKYDDLSQGSDNVYVLRLADMYLIRAEALARSNGDMQAIRDDINMIRNRANLPSVGADTYEELLDIIEKERRVEFAFEGLRWFDLVRTGRAVDVLPHVTNPNQTLFPIPLDEIQSNSSPGMVQNPGY